MLGWSPAVAAVGAVLFTAAVAIRCAGDPPRLISMLVYGLSMVALYVGSAAYHLGDWPAARRLYTLGALIYARRWPDPLPRILGHHELFHLLVAAAGAAFATAIWFWVVPYHAPEPWPGASNPDGLGIDERVAGNRDSRGAAC